MKEAQVFIANTKPLETTAFLKKILPEMTKKRQEKIIRIKNIKGKALSLGAELILRKALFESYAIQGELILGQGDYGKPFLINHPKIHFNLSHSGNYVACVLAKTPVGIDIQKKGQYHKNVVKRYFSDAENLWWTNLAKDKKEMAFFDLWAGKESYMKYTGRGFNLALNDFSLYFDSSNNAYIDEKGEKVNVNLKKYEALEGYVLWCCGQRFKDSLINLDLTNRRGGVF